MNFVVALHAEAKPLIEAFGLSKASCVSPFPLYHGANHQLAVSGIGRIPAAAATGFLLGRCSLSSPSLLNVGIAGHGSMAVGEAFVAHKITDEENPNAFYPPQLFDDEFSTSSLQTCNQPCDHYHEGLGYDMEAHAFYSVASRCVTRECAQVLKVVSDNPQRPASSIDAALATELISERLPQIFRLVEKIDGLADEISFVSTYHELLGQAKKRHCFSQTQNLQMERLFRHAQILQANEQSLAEAISSAKSAKGALRALEKLLDQERIFS